MKYLIKPLTKKMVAQLQKARAIELSQAGRNICLSHDFRSSLPGLYSRGLVNTKTIKVDGKDVLSVYITLVGISFLNRYEEDRKICQQI